MKKQPEIILLVGNIGSGKTTYIKKKINKKFSHIVVSRDALRYMIGAGKYRFDLNIESAIWQSELNIIENFMQLHQNIIVDEIGINRSLRNRYVKLAKKFGYKVIVIQMPIFSMRKSVNRRMKDPHGQPSRKLWESVWKKFDNMYEAPSKKEGIDKIIHYVD